MKSIPVAALAVVVLWIGLSVFWMVGSGVSQGAAQASDPPPGQQAPQACAMMGSPRGGADATGATPPGGGMSSMAQFQAQGADTGIAAETARPAATPGIMTEPVSPIMGLQELYPTPPAASEVMLRLQAVEDRLTAALARLASVESANAAAATTGADNQASNQPAATWVSQLLSVIASGPVIGFLLILLVILAATARGRWMLHGVVDWLARSPTAQAARNSALGTKFRSILNHSQDRARSSLRSTGLDTPQGRAAQWSRLSAQAGRFQQGIVTRADPLLTQLGLVRHNGPLGTNTRPASMSRVYGDVILGTDANGKPLQAGVFEEGQVRAAAGLTLALGTMAFVYAYFAQIYAPIQIVTTLFFFEFLIRVTAGIRYSPMGMIAHWMTRRQTPLWVSAKPKRFAWTLGLVMSLAMMIITNSGIRGPLPLTICLICLTLMWLEAVLGLCLGCEIHRFLVRRGWAGRDEDYKICANDGCVVEARTWHKR